MLRSVDELIGLRVTQLLAALRVAIVDECIELIAGGGGIARGLCRHRRRNASAWRGTVA